MANQPTGFIDVISLTSREIEVPNASWYDGCNLVASNSIGVGIATGSPDLQQQLPSWTLLDQYGAPRTPQYGGQIGRSVNPIYVAQNLGDGAATTLGGATLATLEEGWKVGSSTPIVLFGNSNRYISVPSIVIPSNNDFEYSFKYRRQLNPFGTRCYMVMKPPSGYLMYGLDNSSIWFQEET